MVQWSISHSTPKTIQTVRPDVVYAEVVHLPQGRFGNFIVRPCLRRYEIPFLGRSGAPCEYQLPVTDLHLTIHDGQLILVSKRLGCRVLPRLATAHNPDVGAGLPIYRFLFALQHQATTRVFFKLPDMGRMPFASPHGTWRARDKTSVRLARVIDT